MRVHVSHVSVCVNCYRTFLDVFRRFSKNDLIGTVIMPLKDADLYGMLMRRPIDQRKGLLKVCTVYVRKKKNWAIENDCTPYI